jgi:hypothetical protein
MDDKLGDRKEYRPRGRDPREDLCTLADTIAGSEAGLFNEDGALIWIVAGERVMVTLAALRKICARYLVTRHQRKTANGWEVEYRPYEPDEMTLRTLLGARDWQDGSLVQRLPETPSASVRLSPRLQSEVQQRLATGEPVPQIAEAYRVGTDVIEMIRRAR